MKRARVDAAYAADSRRAFIFDIFIIFAVDADYAQQRDAVIFRALIIYFRR